MMDMWFIFNLLLPFIEVLLHTYMELLNEDDITKQGLGNDTENVCSEKPIALEPVTVNHVFRNSLKRY